MPSNTRDIIINKARELFARNGYEGFSIRTLADECGIGISSIYHFFSDKDVLLKQIFDKTNTELGIARAKLPKRSKASDALFDRIVFQFKHIEEVIFVLKYYLHFRPEFIKLTDGYIPTKAYLHIEEVLLQGIQTGEFNVPEDEIASESKVVAHAINGFLLEYYPSPPRGKELIKVADTIHRFIIRSLTAKEVMMK